MLRIGWVVGMLAVGWVCALGGGLGAAASTEADSKGYAGANACAPCHQSQYERFMAYARKSRSFQSVLQMKKGLTPEELKQCYACHTTGYGKPGGFISFEQTPELKDAGCEVCHGPGKLHIETQNPAHVRGAIGIDVCQNCHTEERVHSFRFKPMVHGGAH